jgi:hypothetical protein
MKEFILGVLLAAVIVLYIHYHDIQDKLNALQLEINLVSNQVNRNNGCTTGIAVLAPGEDFYHPKEVMICQH